MVVCCMLVCFGFSFVLICLTVFFYNHKDFFKKIPLTAENDSSHHNCKCGVSDVCPVFVVVPQRKHRGVSTKISI